MRENENIVYAINSIRPSAGFTVAGTYESLIWDDDQDQVKPTEKEFNDAVTAWNAEYDSQAYARNREAEYPSQGDQNDMMYKDTKNSTTTHAEAVEAVKTKWPKDNSGPIE